MSLHTALVGPTLLDDMYLENFIELTSYQKLDNVAIVGQSLNKKVSPDTRGTISPSLEKE